MQKLYDLTMFDLTEANGCLSYPAPAKHLPRSFKAWERMAIDLSKLLVADLVRNETLRLPAPDYSELKSMRQAERAMQVISYIGQAYQWGNDTPAESLPKQLAVPWYTVGEIMLHRKPILSYASYVLHNWYLIDAARPIELGNVAVLQNFLGGQDEDWFGLIHVAIEAEAGIGFKSIGLAYDAIEHDGMAQLICQLKRLVASQEEMLAALKLMPEKCDPYAYFHRVRPYIHGWKNNPALPNGIVYEGVRAYEGKPQFFMGQTGAQSSIIPILDAAYGVRHDSTDMLSVHLEGMRAYMPQGHRRFIEAVEQVPYLVQLRPSVDRNCLTYPELKALYNRGISLLAEFRETHAKFAAEYIYGQQGTSPGNPSGVGTGGTSFMESLKKHIQDTHDTLL